MFKTWDGEEVLTILRPKETFGNLGREAYCHSKAYCRVLGEGPELKEGQRVERS